MTTEIIPKRRFRFAAWVGGITASLMIATTGVSVAAVRYDAKNAGVMLPGVIVGEVAIGGLPFDVAKDRVMSKYDEPLDRPITIEVTDQLETVTPRELGARTNAIERFEEALRLPKTMSVAERVYRRAMGRSESRRLTVETTIDESKIEKVLDRLAPKVEREPQDARAELVDGAVKLIDDVRGFKLDRKESARALAIAALSEEIRVPLEGTFVDAKVRSGDIKNVLLVKTSENKLYHYRGSELVKVYGVATGTSRYPTPRGTFQVVNKRYRPTWVNPAKYPGGWGWTLPAKIGPGPGNPLGTRALDINSPGIRIHGTYAANSIGYNASHGCIRMRIADIEELFGLVDVGTPVIIVRDGGFKPLPAKIQAQQSGLVDPNGPAPPGQGEPQASPTPSPTPSQLIPG